MNIIVCIKQVPATNKVTVDEKTGVLQRAGFESKTNPYDLYALETALRLKEEYGAVVKAVTMGPDNAAEVIKEAYAMGADEGVLVSDRRFAGSDVLATSHTLSQAIKTLGDFDLILCGRQTTDGDTAQVGAEMSEYLGIPCAAGITKIIGADRDLIEAEMNLTHTLQVMEIKTPCLLCVDKDIYQPRLPSYIKKRETADREIRKLSLDDFEDRDESHYGLSGSPTQVDKIFSPPASGGKELYAGTPRELAGQMLRTLRELKFIGEEN